jgi:hypothetical protein
LPELWELEEPAAATSYLTSLEYKARVAISDLCSAYCDNQVCRRAALLQVGLALYRLDHKKYPPHLADLVPQYLTQLPLDPYSNRPFIYQPDGLDHPLQWRHSVEGVHQGERTEPHTPFFWSVGPGDIRLTLSNSTKYEPADENPPEQERQQKTEPVYGFRTDDSWWWADRVLVFLLPK